MKSSLFLVGASALLATASPIAPEKRDIVTDWVMEVVTVTVTAGQEPTGVVFLEDPEPTTTQRKQRTRRPKPPPVVVTTTVEEAQPEPTQEEVEPEVPEAEPTTPAVDTDITLDDYKTACLDHHNVHRANHSAPALEWDEELAQYAANTANGCVFAHDMFVFPPI